MLLDEPVFFPIDYIIFCPWCGRKTNLVLTAEIVEEYMHEYLEMSCMKKDCKHKFKLYIDERFKKC